MTDPESVTPSPPSEARYTEPTTVTVPAAETVRASDPLSHPTGGAAASTTRSTRLGIALACSTTLLWGVLAVGLKMVVVHVDAGAVAWFRFAFAGAGLGLLLLWKRPEQVRTILQRPPLLGIVAGAALAVNYITFMRGIELTSPTVAQVLIQTGPMLLVLIGLVVFKERLRRWQVIGLGVAAVGMALFYRDQVTHSTRDGLQSLTTANLWTLAAAVSWASYAALSKHLSRSWKPQQLNLLAYVVATVGLFFITDTSSLWRADAATLGLLVLLGLNTLLAYGALGEALRRISTAQVSVIITLNPLVTMVTVVLLEAAGLHWIAPEHVSIYGYLGALVFVFGAVLVVSQPQSGEGTKRAATRSRFRPTMWVRARSSWPWRAEPSIVDRGAAGQASNTQ